MINHTPSVEIPLISLSTREAKNLKALPPCELPDRFFHFYQSKHTLVVAGWPELDAWVLNRQTGRWRECEPVLCPTSEGFIPIYCETAVEKSLAEGIFREGCAHIPQTKVWRAWMETLPSWPVHLLRFPCDRWRLLYGGAKLPGFEKIVRECPLRAYLIAGQSNTTQGHGNMKAMARLSWGKLLEEKGFRNTPFTRRMLCRAIPEVCSPGMIRTMRRVMNSGHAELLEGAEVLSGEPLNIVGSPKFRKLCTRRFLKELWKSESFASDYFLLHKCAESPKTRKRPASPFASLQDLRKHCGGMA